MSEYKIAKSLRWICNQIPDDLGDSNEEKMLKCIKLYCQKGAEIIEKYKTKIENGTLIELPCKVGDTVYAIYQYSDFLGTTGEPFIEKDTAEFFLYGTNETKIIPSKYNERLDFWFRALHICVSREEAEAKLAEAKLKELKDEV